MAKTQTVQHTPGPWTAHDDDGTGTLPCVLSKGVTSYGNFYVAQCNVFADARLIAAAPELLACLRELVEVTAAALHDADEEDQPWLTRVQIIRYRAAIASAEGRE